MARDTSTGSHPLLASAVVSRAWNSTRARRFSTGAILFAVLLAGFLHHHGLGAAAATPRDYLPVGDPIEDELRVLDLLGEPSGPPFRHLHTRPLQSLELRASGLDGPGLRGGRGWISRLRVERFLDRDVPPSSPSDVRSTPRLVQRAADERQRLEISLGLEGALDFREHQDATFADASGAHLRAAAASDRWLAFWHLFAGRLTGARRFADPLLEGHDLVLHTEETYLAYSAEAWGLQFGRSRWHWGPGEEASLLLSKTSAALTGLMVHARLEALRADAAAFSATLGVSGGEQLAAHRLEWQPASSLRIGIAEAARYRSESWEPLYLVGVVPYVLVQRLMVQDQPDSAGSLRNNVLISVDLAWRISPGTRVYAEGLIDDLRLREDTTPDKYGYQIGTEGAGAIGGQSLRWGVELTRLTRFVYSSFFGRSFEAQGRPIGFPLGPDTRRIRVRGAWDPGPDWQLFAAVARTEQGENEIDEPFVPGSPPVNEGEFEAVVERTRELELGVRWWPASGVLAGVRGGYAWVRDAGHVTGVSDERAWGEVFVRLTR